MVDTVRLDDLDFNEDVPKQGKPRPKFKTVEPALRRMRADWYLLLQKMRIQVGNGIKGIKRDYGDLFPDAEVERMEAMCVMPVAALEEQFGVLCDIGVKRDAVAVILEKRVSGVSWRLISQLLGLIGGIAPEGDDGHRGFPNISHLWSYAGLAPQSRREAGKKAGFNPDLKRLMFVIGTCLLKATKGYYAQLYHKHARPHQDRIFNDFMAWLRGELASRRDGGDATAGGILNRIVAQEERAREIDAKKAEGKKPAPMKYGAFQKAVVEAACLLGHELKRKTPREKDGTVYKRAYKFLAILRATGRIVNRIEELEAPYTVERAGDGKAIPIGVPAMTPAHRHNRALMRGTCKVFLDHLFNWWRETEGLEPMRPWILTVGGHSADHYIPPPETSKSDFVAYHGTEARERAGADYEAAQRRIA